MLSVHIPLVVLHIYDLSWNEFSCSPLCVFFQAYLCLSWDMDSILSEVYILLYTVIYIYMLYFCESFQDAAILHCSETFMLAFRGRHWLYSIIPSTPDFPTEYPIRRNSNPAGLPVFAAIWGPGLRTSTIILPHMFKQIKQIRITLMAMFKENPGHVVHQMKYR